MQQQLKMRGSDPQECKDDLKKDLNVKGLDPDGADIRSELEPNDRLEDPVYIDDFLEFWRHPIKHFYRQGLDINLDLNLDSLSDHEVFQHDGLEQYKRAEELLSASLYGDSKDTNRLLRSGDYPIALWGQTMLESYLEKNARLIDTIGALTGQQNVTLTHDAVSLSLDYGDLKLNVEGDIELINGCQILLRNGKLRPLDQLKAYLLHLLRAASLGTEPTAVLTNDAKAAYFTPLSKEESIELLGPWLRWYVTSRSAKVPMLWHISPALAWTEAKQKGDSPWQLHKALLATVEPNGFSRTLADDPYASKHLTSLDDFTQEFYEFSESQLPPMLSLLTVAKPEKAIAMWQESDLTEVN